MNFVSGGLYIRRLRVAGRLSDAPAWRYRAEAALNAANLEPSGLPKSAILCIRKLRNRRCARPDTAHESTHPATSWPGVAAAAVKQCARTAVRPARGAVPANAEAVLFTDASEMLACLARDWCEGAVAGCWWWSALFPGSTPAGTVRKAWTEEPTHVPAALERLYQSGLSTRFLRLLPDGIAAQSCSTAARAFGVGPLSGCLAHALSRAQTAAVARREPPGFEPVPPIEPQQRSPVQHRPAAAPPRAPEC